MHRKRQTRSSDRSSKKNAAQPRECKMEAARHELVGLTLLQEQSASTTSSGQDLGLEDSRRAVRTKLRRIICTANGCVWLRVTNRSPLRGADVDLQIYGTSLCFSGDRVCVDSCARFAKPTECNPL